ncbi:MAG: NAD(P)/FAD-dependent oxidoreductase [Bdellovibrionales bacterium]|nr:NAD(P)/FAD-dependent oxidoreductase [Bdellovibrionales bacterium]
MPVLLQNLKLQLDEDLEVVLQERVPNFAGYDILKKSIDARRGMAPLWVYTVRVYADGEPRVCEDLDPRPVPYKGPPILVVGAGPAGLFAALRLLERGVPVQLFEQGSKAEDRLKAINRYWRYGELNPLNNVGFGEGGAGLYSDGKLITRIKSPHISYVMDRLIQLGAPEEIRYLSNPHVGSDRIRRLIPVLRKRLMDLGGKLYFDTPIQELLISGSEVVGLKTQDGRDFLSPHVVLAAGHSADGLYRKLAEQGVFMEKKSFAVGLRIEHPQKQINQIQYRKHAHHPSLGAANYKLAHHNKEEDAGVYSFCMCPGGYVLASGTEAEQMVCNGMSNYRRNSAFANSALVISIDHQRHFKNGDLFEGLEWRNHLERQAYRQVLKAGGQKEIPAQSLLDFLKGRVTSTQLPSSSPSGVVTTPLHELFSKEHRNFMISAIEDFNKKMKGFISEDAVFHGVESRTSSPLRMTRDSETLQSVSHSGLYPAGEGAGYAGGITSAACDGVRIADRIAEASINHAP